MTRNVLARFTTGAFADTTPLRAVLPVPFSAQDIGDVGRPGFVSLAGPQSFTLNGAGVGESRCNFVVGHPVRRKCDHHVGVVRHSSGEHVTVEPLPCDHLEAIRGEIIRAPLTAHRREDAEAAFAREARHGPPRIPRAQDEYVDGHSRGV